MNLFLVYLDAEIVPQKATYYHSSALDLFLATICSKRSAIVVPISIMFIAVKNISGRRSFVLFICHLIVSNWHWHLTFSALGTTCKVSFISSVHPIVSPE